MFTIYAPPPRAFWTLGSGGQATPTFQGGVHEWVEGGIRKLRVTGVIFLHSSAYASATEWVWDREFEVSTAAGLEQKRLAVGVN